MMLVLWVRHGCPFYWARFAVWVPFCTFAVLLYISVHFYTFVFLQFLSIEFLPLGEAWVAVLLGAVCCLGPSPVPSREGSAVDAEAQGGEEPMSPESRRIYRFSTGVIGTFEQRQEKRCSL